jgi:hypothetical protein
MFDDLLAATPEVSPGAGDALVGLLIARALCPINEQQLHEALTLLAMDWCFGHYPEEERLNTWLTCFTIAMDLMEADAERRYRAVQGENLSL